ncbi:tRNA pseudouridine(38-40) synthase TruA [Fluviispira vulneris]|uniref:tRNA pseudouridine(38-40) synthase TruA n=1 Tax=Fluviispira vulneris TaxID=2763012 RepID=UPI0016484458|nr:tRNA pseudouridine(38-40) synthase TruA [Fluviispira vulneris]
MELSEYRNLKLILSWNGEKFSGYQYQPHAFTVQEAITNAWNVFSGETVTLCGCSRLDAGVHAQYYVLNFHTKTQANCERIVRGMNGILHSHLALDICVSSAEFVNSDFHARFHAAGKHYRYLIWYGFAEHAFLTKRAWHVRSKISPESVCEILKQFEGEHDFAAFRSSDCSAKTTVRKVLAVDAWIHPIHKEMIIVDIWGEGFLKNMIRNMVGTAVEMATGKKSLNTITESFVHKDRTKTGMCAPAWPLTLMHVYYDKEKILLSSKNKAQKQVPC